MRSSLLSLGFAIALLTSALPLHAAQSSAAPLRVGSTFPAFSGRTITNRPLTLPEASIEKPSVLVFTFSRTAGKDAQLWNEHLAKDFAQHVSAYGVIELESAPKLFRRLAIYGIESSMSTSAQNRTVVLYRDGQLWGQRLAVKDENRAYVVLLDRSGTIRWISPGTFSDEAYEYLKTEIAALLRLRS